jgi:oxalate decarboxylase
MTETYSFTSTSPDTLGNPGHERRGKSVVEFSPASASDPGPKNPMASEQAPSSELPPSTDRGDFQNFWFPFARAHKRIQEGGWARQITVRDLPLSTSIAGVNMRLLNGAIRELHWHQANEWAIMLYGNARITAFDQEGRNFIHDVKEGDLWFFPSGFPHSIQGLGPDGCEFLLVFDDGNFSEDETFLISDWMAHTPVEVLAKNFGLPTSAFNHIPQQELYIFPSKVTQSLDADLRAATGPQGNVPQPYFYSLYEQKPDLITKGGNARIVDSHNFPISKSIAAAYITVHPGGMREMHWHPNADEWLYFISGKGRITLFSGVGHARTMDFQAGDVGYIPRAMGHYFENTGDTDARYLEVFKSSYFSNIALTNWMSHLPPELVQAHTHMSPEAIASLPKIESGFRPL